jgi:hypothetical protein
MKLMERDVYTGPFFYLATIICRLMPPLCLACGRSVSRLRTLSKRIDIMWQPTVAR